MENFSDKYSDEDESLNQEEYLEDEEVFSSPYTNKGVSSSVHEFLKQSSEIQMEIQKLSNLCQQISPQKENFIEEEPPEPEGYENSQEYEENSVIWDDINQLLKTHGLAPLILITDKYGQELPETGSLKDAVIELTTEFSNLYRKFSEATENSKALEKKLQSQEQSIESYKKLEKTYNDLKNDYKILLDKSKREPSKPAPKLKPLEERPLSMFKAFMHQSFDPKNDSDCRSMALIQHYEEKLKKLSSELHDHKKDLQTLNISNRKLQEKSFEYSESHKKALKEFDADSQEKSKILQTLSDQLKLRTYKDLPRALEKIQKVILTVPTLDKFFKEVCEEICPGSFMRVEELLEEIRLLKHQKFLLEKFKANVLEMLMTGSDPETFDKIKALMYFCKLFEVRPSDDLVESIEGIFFFVHEIKVFLNCCRKSLGIGQDYGVRVVLEEVMKCVQNELGGVSKDKW